MWFYYKYYKLKLQATLLLLVIVGVIFIKYWYILLPLGIFTLIKLEKVVKEQEEKLNAPYNEVMDEVNKIRAKLFKLKRQYDEATTYDDRYFYRNCALDCRYKLWELRKQVTDIEPAKFELKMKIVSNINILDNSINTDFYGRK